MRRFVSFSSPKFGEMSSRFTPKELRLIAQGCSRSELPSERHPIETSTPKGFRHREFSKAATPSG